MSELEISYLDFLKKYKIPIPEDYKFDPILDMEMEINSLEDWMNWYDKFEKMFMALEEMRESHTNRIITYIQQGKWDSKHFFKDLEMFFKFANLRFRENEFWEKSFFWLLKMSNKKSDLSPKHLFRIEVLKRDKWTCRKCGKHCNSAHHIFSRIYCQKYAPELEWDIQNGVALCFYCHKAITNDGKNWFKENKK